MELAGVGLTFWLTWSSIGWLKVTINDFHSFCLRWGVALATLKPLIFQRGSWGLFLRPRKAANTEADVEGAAWSGESRTKRKPRKGKWKETYTHISSFFFKPASHHIDLYQNCNMNLDSTYMEMKFLKGKYITIFLTIPIVWTLYSLWVLSTFFFYFTQV